MKPTFFYRIIDAIFRISTRWDKLAPGEDTAIDFAHTHINEDPREKDDMHQYTMEYCLAYSGESINARFRQNRAEEIDFKIAAMVDEHITNTNLVLYRGIACDHVFALMQNNAKEIPNCDLYEKGFLACSLVKGHEINSNIKLRIYVPAGTKCVYQGKVNDEQNFYEVDVMHSSKLKIISIDKEYINCRLLATA